MRAEEIWAGRSGPARLFRLALTPFSWLYSLGWQLYLGLYRTGLKRAREPHVPVVCVGNLLVGGTGKTPVTVFLADTLRELGYEVVVACSGYGSPASEAARVAPEGELDAAKWGDEVALVRDLRPDLPIVVGRRRVLAAKLCHEHFPSAVMLLDDGFQHLPLKKHLTIVLDPPVDNRRCLPAGPYREPRRNRSRADLVLPGEFDLRSEPLSLKAPGAAEPAGAGKVDALCAIGRPEGFLAGLREAGFQVGEVVLRPDHDPLSDGNLLRGLSGPIAVTGKDWVKLRGRPDIAEYEILVASYSVTIEPRDEFRGWLQAKLDGILQKETRA